MTFCIEQTGPRKDPRIVTNNAWRIKPLQAAERSYKAKTQRGIFGKPDLGSEDPPHPALPRAGGREERKADAKGRAPTVYYHLTAINAVSVHLIVVAPEARV